MPPVVGGQCRKCGTQFAKPNAKFCSRCGEKRPPSSRRPSAMPREHRGGSGSADPSSTVMLPSLVESTVRPQDRAEAAAAAAAASQRRGPVPVLPPKRPPTALRPHSNRRDSDKVRLSSSRKTFDPFEDSTLPQGSTASGNSVLGEDEVEMERMPPLPPGGDDDYDYYDEDGEYYDEEDEENGSTVRVGPELEAKFSVWATLGPDGITPEMLQTANAAELRSWRRGSLVGRGTYGSVFLGLLPTGSFHAVKVVELGGKKTDHFSAAELVSLSREINLMQRLRHRNLCKFTGVLYEPDNNSICMFMEYIGGGPLSAVVKRFKPLPPDVVRRWTKQLLVGLLYLHSQRIIHRDIKGDNVLIDTTTNPDTEAQVKLVDFGAARRLTDAVSQSRTVIGTPYWMAPEVVDMGGEGKGYSYKADVWSAGCTVAEMLTGKPPWPSRANAAAAIMMIASAKGMPTEIPEAEATPGCLDFMKRCFTVNCDERPTVEELLQHPWILGKMK